VTTGQERMLDSGFGCWLRLPPCPFALCAADQGQSLCQVIAVLSTRFGSDVLRQGISPDFGNSADKPLEAATVRVRFREILVLNDRVLFGFAARAALHVPYLCRQRASAAISPLYSPGSHRLPVGRNEQWTVSLYGARFIRSQIRGLPDSRICFPYHQTADASLGGDERWLAPFSGVSISAG